MVGSVCYYGYKDENVVASSIESRAGVDYDFCFFFFSLHNGMRCFNDLSSHP
jgi:hypothetical protein